MDTSTIPDRLRVVREEAGYTSQALVEALEERHGISMTRTNVSHYEHGRNRPRVDYVVALCKLAEVNPTWVLTGEGPKRWEWGDDRRKALSIVVNYLEGLSRKLRRELEEADTGKELEERKIPLMPIEAYRRLLTPEERRALEKEQEKEAG